MKRGNTKLVDPTTGVMECLKCGKKWHGIIARGGKFQRGAWQCENGCTKRQSK